MKRLIHFLIAFVFLVGMGPAHSAEKKEVKKVDKAAAPQEATPLKTTYHALIIGNNQYKHLPRLKTARNDAVEVEKLLREKFGFQTDILLDATRTDILGRINQIRKRLGEKDSLLIYYAGHGEYDTTVDKAYWLPVDAHGDDPTNWIIADDITSNIKRIAAHHVLIVSDSCYSGTLGRQAITDLIATGGREGYLKKMQERPSRTLMASGGNEPVSDSGGGNNSVFAAAFLKALKESDKAIFTAEEIFHGRIKPIVAGKSDQVPEYCSLKNSGDEGGDFVFRLASVRVEPLKTTTDIKVQSQEEDKQFKNERKKIEGERRRLEAERKATAERLDREATERKAMEEETRKLRKENQKTSQAVKDLEIKGTGETKVASLPKEIARPEPPKAQERVAGPKLAIFPMYITQFEDRFRDKFLKGIRVVISTMDLFGEVFSYYDYQGKQDSRRIRQDLPINEIWKRKQKGMFSKFGPSELDVEAVCKEAENLGVDAVLTLYSDVQKDSALCILYVINVGNRKVYSAKGTLPRDGKDNELMFLGLVKQALVDYKKDR